MHDRIEQPLAALADRLRQAFLDLISIYRFGSFGTAYERPDSDLDFAMLESPCRP